MTPDAKALIDRAALWAEAQGAAWRQGVSGLIRCRYYVPDGHGTYLDTCPAHAAHGKPGSTYRYIPVPGGCEVMGAADLLEAFDLETRAYMLQAFGLAPVDAASLVTNQPTSAAR